MPQSTDYTKMFKDMMGSFPVDTSAMQNAFKTQALYGEKLSKVTIEAAERSTEIASKWTKDVLSRLHSVTTVKEDMADYGKALNDFASAQSQIASDNLAAFAEVAKKVQMEAVELMLSAGKTATEDTTAAVKKAAAEVSIVPKKTAASAV